MSFRINTLKCNALRFVHLAFLCFFAVQLSAQTRNLNADLASVASKGKSRSVGLAFVLSAAVPGAGQAYNKQWIKMGVAGGIEAFVLVTQFSYNKTGNRLEDELENRADTRFNAVNYAQWLNNYSGYKGSKIVISTAVRQIDFANSASWTDTQKAEVRTLFDAIRTAEEKSVYVKTGASFSHKLPYFGEQQYYELMGKYYQYAPGWSDYNGADDPEAEDASGKKINASTYFLQHASDQAAAQKYLRKASRLSTALVFNHILAAFDAALSAKLHNNRLSTGLAIGTDADGNLLPTIGFSYRF